MNRCEFDLPMGKKGILAPFPPTCRHRLQAARLEVVSGERNETAVA